MSSVIITIFPKAGRTKVVFRNDNKRFSLLSPRVPQKSILNILRNVTPLCIGELKPDQDGHLTLTAYITIARQIWNACIDEGYRSPDEIDMEGYDTNIKGRWRI